MEAERVEGRKIWERFLKREGYWPNYRSLESYVEDIAKKYIDFQRDSFKRLGVTADWDNPYILWTLSLRQIYIELSVKWKERSFSRETQAYILVLGS